MLQEQLLALERAGYTPRDQRCIQDLLIECAFLSNGYNPDSLHTYAQNVKRVSKGLTSFVHPISNDGTSLTLQDAHSHMQDLLKKGIIVGICGPPGSGKTTFLQNSLIRKEYRFDEYWLQGFPGTSREQLQGYMQAQIQVKSLQEEKKGSVVVAPILETGKTDLLFYFTSPVVKRFYNIRARRFLQRDDDTFTLTYPRLAFLHDYFAYELQSLRADFIIDTRTVSYTKASTGI